jgi:DNA-binding beta-propeller fold protein YncE
MEARALRSSTHAAPSVRHLEKAHPAASVQPNVLPGPVLIADRGNNRLVMVNPRGQVVWTFPRPGDLRPGQSFRSPDDAFFSPDGKQIIVTQEDDFVISVIDVASRRIVYRYGVPGVPGSGPNHLWNPDDAMLFRGGWILVSDIKNCRLLLIKVGEHRPHRIYGATTQSCYHAPPAHWGSPNGAFPMLNGHVLVTEINGDWVNEMSLAGTVVRSWHPPGFTYPSDTNEVKPGLYLSVDYTSPGGLETFDRQGRLRWRYEPRSTDPPLDHPSLAKPLPNGDVLLNDDGNDRVIVVDPHTNKIVWQYGKTGVPGRALGYLNDPDGLDLAPPNSLLIQRPVTIPSP